MIFFFFRRHKIQIIRFCLPFDVLKLKSERRFQLTFNACRLIKGKSLRLHFDAIWVFLYYSYSSKIKSIWLETKFMQQSRVNNKYLIIRFNTLLLSHKTSRLAKNRTQVRTASKQHGRLNTDLISLFFSREAWVNIFISLYLRIK